jgi:hypothetical protein
MNLSTKILKSNLLKIFQPSKRRKCDHGHFGRFGLSQLQQRLDPHLPGGAHWAALHPSAKVLLDIASQLRLYQSLDLIWRVVVVF